MTVYPMGPVMAGGGTVVVAVGAPNVAVVWSLTGLGTLTALTDRTDGAGVASAKYDATGVPAGSSVTIQVNAYA